jgi:hypothetical protein
MDEKQFQDLMQVEKGIYGLLTDIKFELVNRRLREERETGAVYTVPTGKTSFIEGFPESVKRIFRRK